MKKNKVSGEGIAVSAQARRNNRMEAEAKTCYEIFMHRSGPSLFPAWEELPEMTRQGWREVVIHCLEAAPRLRIKALRKARGEQWKP